MEDQDEIIAKLIQNYQPSARVGELIAQTAPVFLVGISGAGKDAIKRELLKTGQFYDFVSHTTRPPRENNGVMELDGEDYYFIDKTEAIRMLENGEFIEAKFVHGKVYGTSVAEFERAIELGKMPLNDIDYQGVEEYRRLSDKIVPIFVLPPSFKAWQERMRDRYTDQTEFGLEWQKRKITAKFELAAALKNQYYCLINDNLDWSVKKALEIISGHISESDQQVARRLARDFLLKLELHE